MRRDKGVDMGLVSSVMGLFGKTTEPVVPRVLVFCGAGVSQESGLKTFRCENGLWRSRRPEEICDMRTFHANRESVFDFYNERKKDISEALPNAAHEGLSSLVERLGKDRCSVFTSNVDDLLERAGIRNVVHVHGSVHDVLCLSCGHVAVIGDAAFDPSFVCPSCGSADTKPGVVFFNERAPLYTEMTKAFESAGDFVGDDRIPTIKLVVGTSFSVIKKDRFFLSRSRSVLLDPSASGEGFDVIVAKSAVSGIDEALAHVERFVASPKACR